MKYSWLWLPEKAVFTVHYSRHTTWRGSAGILDKSPEATQGLVISRRLTNIFAKFRSTWKWTHLHTGKNSAPSWIYKTIFLFCLSASVWQWKHWCCQFIIFVMNISTWCSCCSIDWIAENPPLHQGRHIRLWTLLFAKPCLHKTLNLRTYKNILAMKALRRSIAFYVVL